MFYLKLAINNFKQSFSQFAPFFLVSITTFTFATITSLILLGPTSQGMGAGSYALMLAYIVLLFLSGILCLYSYQFLLKQRSKEFGLYHMLGMNKKQIWLVATLELLLAYLLTVGIGSIFSAAFSNVFYLIFVNLIQYKDLQFHLSALPFFQNALAFAGIFFLLEIASLFRIGKTSALHLFRTEQQGEREPRGNVLLAIIGILAIGFGYYLSLTGGQLSAVVGIVRFFKAILAVIVGTYLFYISFMTWYLKARRKNKEYFYQPAHFVSTSQMIFRMKQNAVGLANITLLAIMAFVTIFSTVALYSGTDSLVEMNYPKNSLISVYDANSRAEANAAFENTIGKALKEADVSDTSFKKYLTTSFTVLYSTADELVVDEKSTNPSDYFKNNPAFQANVGMMEIMTQADFRALGNSLPELAAGEVAFYSYNNKNNLTSFTRLNWFGQLYQKTQTISSLKEMVKMNAALPAGLLIVPDDATLENMRTVYNANLGNVNNQVTYNLIAFADLTESEQALLAQNEGFWTDNTTALTTRFSTRESYRQEALQMTGGFLFTGFLLGIAFLLGAALIIYYKQLSEGIQDQRSYKILQEVGMSLQQVKQTINSQILLVFFMPLGLALLHFLFALPILKKFLLLFGVQGDMLIYSISAITVLVILLIYFAIYKLTSKAYSKLIER